MNYVRIIIKDNAGNYGEMTFPVNDFVQDEQVLQLAADVQDVISAGVQRVDFLEAIGQNDDATVSGATDKVSDIAVLLYTGSGPFGLAVPILAPSETIMDGPININIGNSDVYALTGQIELDARDMTGAPLTLCLGGRIVGNR